MFHKRYPIAVLLLVILLVVPAALALATPMYVNTANQKGLNMRVDMSTDSTVITVIPFGAEVEVNSFEESDYWADITYRNMGGYVMTRYLSYDQPSGRSSGGGSGSSGGSVMPSADTYRDFYETSYYTAVRPSTPTGYVNMRWAPSKSAEIHGSYYQGYTLLVIAENGVWCQVYDEAIQSCGFIMRNFLQ